MDEHRAPLKRQGWKKRVGNSCIVDITVPAQCSSSRWSAILRLLRISVKILSKLWRVAFVQQVAQVIVNMWLELLICGAASVAVLILIVDRS